MASDREASFRAGLGGRTRRTDVRLKCRLPDWMERSLHSTDESNWTVETVEERHSLDTVGNPLHPNRSARSPGLNDA